MPETAQLKINEKFTDFLSKHFNIHPDANKHM